MKTESSFTNIQALLFDLGNVLIEVDFKRAFQHWQQWSNLGVDEMMKSFQFDEPYQRHERGEISAADYFHHLRKILSLQNIKEVEMIAGWNAIFPAEVMGMREMLAKAHRTLPCYLFSNTNAMHQQQWMQQFPEIVQPMKHLFLSHEIGLRKPEPAAFEHISHTIHVPLERILFFDDLLENVEGARAVGMQAVHVSTPHDVHEALDAMIF